MVAGVSRTAEELCRVEQPLVEVSFCSEPLYKAARMAQEVPTVLEDWLRYHVGYLGFGRADVYDLDGSLGVFIDRARRKLREDNHRPRCESRGC